jgi:hypothetical protein
MIVTTASTPVFTATASSAAGKPARLDFDKLALGLLIGCRA